MRVCLALIAAAGFVLAGCESDPLSTGPQDPGVRLDAGRIFPDARPPAEAGSNDAARDAGVALEDAAAPDAAEPECVCPPLPSRCTPPVEGAPAFTSLDDESAQKQLFDVIACAESSLHIAIYQTTWSCIVNALSTKLAADNDLVVQLVIDDDQCPRIGGRLDCELATLDAMPRVAIVDDARSRYMHHKFIVADGRRVWISSGNFTKASFCGDYNHSLVIGEPSIVGGYEAEFQRMYTAREFGPVEPRAPIEEGGLALYFSPESPVSQRPRWFGDLVRAVETASTSIDFMIFALTRHEVSNAVISAHQRGVQVRGVVSPEFRGELAIEAMLTAQVPIRVGPVHAKVMIIDGVRVATGSPNWSENAWGNNEASLWLSSPNAVTEFGAEMDRVWAGATLP